MRIQGRFVNVFLVAVALLAAPLSRAQDSYPYARPTDRPTALDRYVAKPDPNYKWELVRTEKEDDITSYTIDLTSQQWRTEKEVDKPIWKHWLTITVPNEVDHPTALLFIDGGNNKDSNNPRGADGDMKKVARQTKCITSTVFMVPNQPLVFSDAMGWGRSEDAMIAYTWDKFYRTGDEEWPARLPMTKAAVRAMDTVQAFCASEAGGKHEVKDFVVAGGSKRGWTTWTTAIVDTRVKAIAPCVIDLLHLIPSFRHHWTVYGRWSAAVGDYQALRILDWLDTPENKALMDIEDPYYYRDRLQMPKFIMNGANDQFFVPDSSQFYWNDLEGPKWLRYVPNAGHGLDNSAIGSVAAFFHAVAADTSIPNYTFEFEDDGGIVVKLLPTADGTVVKPTSVKLWQAYNPKARDVRGSTAEYVASDIAESEPNVYRAAVAPKDTGYVLYFVELVFPGPVPETPFTFTSGVLSAPKEPPFTYNPPANPPKGFLSKK